MEFDRRRLLQLAALAALPATTTMAQAQSYPAKPVRFVVSFPPGGPNDILGRIVAGWLSQKLGQPFNVENKGGRSGNIGTEEVVRAAPDGYTVLLCGPANAISGSLYSNLPFNFLRDIVPVAGITREALVMVVHPSVPANTVPEFLAYAKANTGKIKMASTGNGSSPHVTGELFKQMTGLNLEVVHYGGGGPALQGDDRRRSADDVRADVGVDRAGAQRQAPRARGQHDAAFDGVAGGAAARAVRAGLRGERGDRHRRAEGHAGRRSSRR